MRSSLACFSIQPVTLVSAGPPFGGLYLKPPVSGGLCEGVMTMPSASPLVRPRFQVSIACEMAGVGVYSSFSAIMTSTPLAASTSSALAAAGTESACVSMPRYSGPSIPCCLRYLQMASVMPTTCHSLKLFSNAEPRCPDVPNATRWPGTLASGTSV